MKWIQRLRVASKRNAFTDEDIQAASQWSSCAVGERNGGIEPVGETNAARRWGMAFFEAVKHNRVTLAIAIRKEILRETR